MANARFERVTRTFEDTVALDEFTLDVHEGEFLILVGPSGCGKTTALRCLSGLDEPDSGAVYIGDEDVTYVEPAERDVAMVFQNYALYPYLSVFDNIAFPLKMRKVPKQERRKRVLAVAEMLDIERLLGRKPRELSGGQRQRVALGRAIVREPAVFLMDEPLSNLDAQLRGQTRTELIRLQRQLGVTTIYVTHDQVEAMTMGQRIAVLHEGRLQQVAAPLEIYARPANIFVAGFIGNPPMNLLPATVDHEHRHLITPHGRLSWPEASTDAIGGRERVVAGLRPEDARVLPAGEPASSDGALSLLVDVVEALGSDAFVSATDGLRARLPDDLAVRREDCLRLEVKPGRLHLFDPDSGERLL
jgi:multiple sugar transport system ATP-binding protein